MISLSNHINKYSTESAYTADETKQYPNVSLIEDSGIVKMYSEYPIGEKQVVLKLSDGTYEVHTYNDGVIPNNAFKGRTDIVSAKIGEGITEIKDGANGNQGCFNGCSNMSSILLPSTLTKIGNYAFFNCISLTSIDFPIALTRIGSGSFYRCSGITELNITENIASIDNNAFGGCSFNIVNYPSVQTMLNIDYYPDSIITDVSDPKKVASKVCIAGNEVTSIVIPSSYTEIKFGAFNNCIALSSVTYEGNSVTTIGENAFRNCSSYINVTIPNSVTSIGARAYGNIYSLESIQISSALTTVGRQAFMGSPAANRPPYRKINYVFPESLTTFNEEPFQDADISVTLLSDTPPTITGNRQRLNNYNPVLVYVKASALETYQADSTFSNTSKFNLQAIPTE